MSRQEAAKVVAIKFNTETVYVQDAHFSIGTLLTFHTNVLQYMSSHALLELLDKTADTLLELGVCVKQANDAKTMVEAFRIRKDPVLQRYAWVHELPPFREMVLGVICEYILRADNLGRLHGFTAVKCHAEEGSNVGDSNSLCNPEMKTLRSV